MPYSLLYYTTVYHVMVYYRNENGFEFVFALILIEPVKLHWYRSPKPTQEEACFEGERFGSQSEPTFRQPIMCVSPDNDDLQELQGVF